MIRLALRDLVRYRTRTLLVAFVSAYVVFATLVYLGFMDAYGESVKLAHARYIWAPVTVAKETWFDDPEPENGLEDPSLPARVEALAGTRTTPRLLFSALAESPYKTLGVEALGVDPKGERGISKVPGRVKAGRWLKAPGEVVLGRGLARDLDVRLGERLVLSAAHLAGPRSLGLVVVGLVEAKVSNVDRFGLYLHIADARRLTGLPTATHLAVDAPLDREAAIARRLNRALGPPYAARDAWAMVGPIKTDVELGRVFGRYFGWLLALLSALAVTSTLYVSVLERTREFGAMQALGMTPASLAVLVTLEGALAAALGWAAGLALGYGFLFYAHTHNVLGPLFALSAAVWPDAGLFEEVYTPVRAVYALSATSVIWVAAAFAFFFPARRALRLEVARALRWEA